MMCTYLTSVLLFLSTCGIYTKALTIPPLSASSNITIGGEPDGHLLTQRQAPVNGDAIPRNAWTVAVDSIEPDADGTKVFDGDPNSIWHTEWRAQDPPLPHTITIDLNGLYNVNGLRYLPRQDGLLNGNIGQHQIFLSTDGTNFALVAFGTYIDDATLKTTVFETLPARYVRMVALTEGGGRGPWTSAAEINVYAAAAYAPPPNGVGRWGPTIDFPLIPVAAALLPDGKVLAWSAFSPSDYAGGNGGQTITATYDPAARLVTQRTVTVTGHDMFCPGTSFDANGRLIVQGGSFASKTSIYDASADAWIPGAEMNIARGYQSSSTTSDGRVFVIGGSWSGGGYGGRTGEVYDSAANTWTVLPNCPADPILTADAEGVYRSDNHAWLFGWKTGHIFHAGPSKAMNWFSTQGAGGYTGAGTRGADADAMCGNAVMYDAVNGKILTVGGSPNYDRTLGSTAAHVITIGNVGEIATVTTTGGLAFARTFANAVVLPNGHVIVTGGQLIGLGFTDDNPTLTPEIWDPATGQFTQLLPNSVPRTYHSVSLLLLDGTVLSGGGGLCGACAWNHFDAQIYTPQYLLNPDGSPAVRPIIEGISANTIGVGGTIVVNVDSTIATAALIRLGSVTHSVNTDQRRVPLEPVNVGGNAYSVVVPGDPGVALPGYWMLFVMNAGGVPSVARTVLIQ